MKAAETQDERPVYRVSEWAKATGLGRSTVEALVADGTIPTCKVRGSVLIPKTVSDALLSPQGGESPEVTQ